MVQASQARLGFVLSLCIALSVPANAEPLASPGDALLRHDLQLLNDSGVISVPLTAWPVAFGDVVAGLESSTSSGLSDAERAALGRVRDYVGFEMETGVWTPGVEISFSKEPRAIRRFDLTPREKAEASASLSWMGERFALKLAATYADDPFDGEDVRPDGTYLGVALGNWSITAGWQERWWGPGHDGSLILGTNARPTPGIAIQRIASRPFETKWLSWIGPWTLTSFMSHLDDDRVINDALLFGVRGTFRPRRTGLEIGVSRTAQWCGDERPCSARTFVDLLLGKDNRGVNVDPDDEPGNQLAGFDIRWRLPKKLPVALYMQWIGEDGRANGLIGNWNRQLGIEHWGTVGRYAFRAHAEVSDTQARQGGFGFSDPRVNYTYNHYIYQTGYRYEQRSLGHGMDGDGLMYSVGSTLVGENGGAWGISLRSIEINRTGTPDPRHSLSRTPVDQIDALITHERITRFGRFHAGIGYVRVDDSLSDSSTSDVSGFIRWSSN